MNKQSEVQRGLSNLPSIPQTVGIEVGFAAKNSSSRAYYFRQ